LFIYINIDDFLTTKKKVIKTENQTDLYCTDIDEQRNQRKYTAAYVMDLDSDEYYNFQKNKQGNTSCIIYN